MYLWAGYEVHPNTYHKSSYILHAGPLKREAAAHRLARSPALMAGWQHPLTTGAQCGEQLLVGTRGGRQQETRRVPVWRESAAQNR